MTANEGAYAIGKRGATGTIILLLGRERCLRNVVGAHVRVQLCHRHLRHLDSRTRKLLPRATVKEPVGPPGVQDLGQALRMRMPSPSGERDVPWSILVQCTPRADSYAR